MTDTNRLAALLHDTIHAGREGANPCPACLMVAARLIAAGVTLAATPAPLNNKRVEQTFKFLREVCDLPDSSASDEYVADRFIKAYTKEEWNDH
jgi:hypothetical protein